MMMKKKNMMMMMMCTSDKNASDELHIRMIKTQGLTVKKLKIFCNLVALIIAHSFM